MERYNNDYADLIARWKVELIGRRARKFFFRVDEVPDLEQIIVQELLKTSFEPGIAGGASEKGFVIAVIDRQLMKVKRDRQRDVRKANLAATSLCDAQLIEQASPVLSRSERHELRLDVQQALAHMTPVERAICKALIEGHSQAEIARRTKRSPAAISNEVRKLREKLRELMPGEDESA